MDLSLPRGSLSLSLSLDVSFRWSWWFWGVRTSSEVRSGVSGFVGGSLFCSLFGSYSVRNSSYVGVLFYMIIAVLWSRGSLSSWWFFSAWYNAFSVSAGLSYTLQGIVCRVQNPRDRLIFRSPCPTSVFPRLICQE